MGAIKGNSTTLMYKAEPTNSAADIDNDLAGASYLTLTGVTSASVNISNSTFEAVSITDPANDTTVRDFAVGTTSTSLSVEECTTLHNPLMLMSCSSFAKQRLA